MTESYLARVKEKFYKVVVGPAMLYGMRMVTTKKKAKLEIAELKVLRFSGK